MWRNDTTTNQISSISRMLGILGGGYSSNLYGGVSMDYILVVMLFIAFGLNFVILMGLAGAGCTNVIIDLFDKKFKQYRLADSLVKSVEKSNKDFKVVVITSGDYEILIARKIKDSTNDQINTARDRERA